MIAHGADKQGDRTHAHIVRMPRLAKPYRASRTRLAQLGGQFTRGWNIAVEA